MKYWKTPQFKKLQQDWDQKLESSGFRDEEKLIGTARCLKQRASNVYRQADMLTRESKQRFYELLAQRVQERRGTNPLDMSVMRMYSEGMQINEIRDKLALGGGAD